MIRTLIFDLGNTIIPFDFTRAYHRMRELTTLEPDDLRARIRATGLVPRLESGLIEPRDFVRRFGEATGLEMSYDDFCELWSSIFLRETLIPEVFLERLRARYRMVLLSNTNAIHFPMILGNYPHMRHFDDFVLSYEVKVMKPERAIYERAIEKAGCRPEEIFFTDDIPDYVEGARLAGIDAAQFQGLEQLREDLRRRGVDC